MRPGMGRPGLPPLSAEELQQDKQFEDQVRKLHDDHAEREKRVRRIAGEARALMAELSRKGEKAEGNAQLAKMRDDLTAAVKEQFETRTQLRQLEITRMQRDADRLRKTAEEAIAEVKRRGDQRDTILQKRVEQLLGVDKGDGW